MGRKATIGAERITAAAVELLDEAGLAELSTRRLAGRLGVQSPTLYWHVKNKAELLDLVAEAICADAFDIDETLPWRDQLAEGMAQFRQLVLSHRDVAQLLRERPPTGPHRRRHIETTLRILADAGFDERESAGITELLAAHVLTSLPDRTAEHGLTDQERFDLGTEIILDGLTARAARANSAARDDSATNRL